MPSPPNAVPGPGEFAGGDLETPVSAALSAWDRDGASARLWARDQTLWSGTDEDRWLGWLDAVAVHQPQAEALLTLATTIRDEGFRHLVVLGMGGSSLCPDVLARSFGVVPDYPHLLVLDSVVPAAVRAIEQAIDPARTLFIVASKSGGTTEPNVLYRYFRPLVEASVGGRAGQSFIAVTDPGSSLERVAMAEHFRHVAAGVPTIGGRFSALSNFGLLPAALMGLDVADLLERASRMVAVCGASVPAAANPGVFLGTTMAIAANAGRDKLTLLTSPSLSSLGAWIEQLVAESTGKHGKGVIPIDGESVVTPEHSGNDRLFVYTRLTPAPDPTQDLAVKALRDAGHPVFVIDVGDERDLFQEMFRWELATAVCGKHLRINPFDQPDVEAAKIATRRLVEVFEQSGNLPADEALLHGHGLTLHADANNAASLTTHDLGAAVRSHLDRLGAGDYLAIQAYVAMSPRIDALLQRLRHAIRDRSRVATTLGYGPRFLHSTGQLHKGGPATGLFLQITSDDHEDLAIPNQRLSFGALKQAQALGDLEVLNQRKRRVLRVHLGADVGAGLTTLHRLITATENAQ